MKIEDKDIEIYNEETKRLFQEYLDSLAEFRIAYKEVMNERADKVYKHKFDFKLLARESFLYHMHKFYSQEAALFEATEILRRAENYKPKG